VTFEINGHGNIVRRAGSSDLSPEEKLICIG